MQSYNAVLRRQLKRMGIDFQQFDLIEGMDELKEFDPGFKLMQLHQRFLQLGQSQKNIFETGDFSTFQETFGNDENQVIYTEVVNFLDQFGHLSDTTSLFSNPPWRETPGLVLQLIANYTDTTVRNETSGQIPSETVAKGSAETRIRYQDLPKKSRMFRTFYQRSRQFRLYRERISSLYSYSLMLFRAYYLAIGDHMTNQQILQSREDILYLYDDEVRAWIRAAEISHEDDRVIGLDYASKVEFRKQEMEQCQDAILPEIIFGDEVPLILASTSDKLTGTPTSKGYCTGPVRVIHGLEDFHKLNAGDILVIPFSDVSWTPLFAKAGAVVAESGGILSHSSIIAREYNIPAVVSVPGALLLEDDMLVTVDGFKGEILIHTEVQIQVQTAEEIT
jgi:pyruvate,water dikinase